jgi:hypothetical protein
MGRRKVEGNELVEQWNVLLGEHIALVNHYAQMPKDGDRDDRNLPAPNQAGAGRGDRQVVSSRGGVRTAPSPAKRGRLEEGGLSNGVA